MVITSTPSAKKEKRKKKPNEPSVDPQGKRRKETTKEKFRGK